MVEGGYRFSKFFPSIFKNAFKVLIVSFLSTNPFITIYIARGTIARSLKEEILVTHLTLVLLEHVGVLKIEKILAPPLNLLLLEQVILGDWG